MSHQYSMTFVYVVTIFMACGSILVESEVLKIDEWKSSDEMTSEELLEKEGDMDNLNVALIFSSSGRVQAKIEKTGKNRYTTLVKVVEDVYSKFQQVLTHGIRETVETENSKENEKESNNPFETSVQELK